MEARREDLTPSVTMPAMPVTMIGQVTATPTLLPEHPLEVAHRFAPSGILPKVDASELFNPNNPKMPSEIGKVTLDCLEVMGTKGDESRRDTIAMLIEPIVSNKAGKKAINELIGNLKVKTPEDRLRRELIVSGFKNVKHLTGLKPVSQATTKPPEIVNEPAANEASDAPESNSSEALTGQLQKTLDRPKLSKNAGAKIDTVLSKFESFDSMVTSVTELMDESGYDLARQNAVSISIGRRFAKYMAQRPEASDPDKLSDLSVAKLDEWLRYSPTGEFSSQLQRTAIGSLIGAPYYNPLHLFEKITDYIISSDASPSCVEAIAAALYDAKNGVYTRDRTKSFFRERKAYVEKIPSMSISVATGVLNLALKRFADQRKTATPAFDVEARDCGCEHCVRSDKMAQRNFQRLLEQKQIEEQATTEAN